MSHHLEKFQERSKNKVTRPVVEATILSIKDIEQKLLFIDSLSERVIKLEGYLKAIQSQPAALPVPDPIVEDLKNAILEKAAACERLNQDIVVIDGNGEDDNDDCITIATEDGIELITATPELRQCGKWTVDKEMCKGCIKTKSKTYIQEKKGREKEQKKTIKDIKIQQKRIVESEQMLLKKRLDDIRRGSVGDYTKDELRQEEMRKELTKLAKNGESDSHFSVNLFI